MPDNFSEVLFKVQGFWTKVPEQYRILIACAVGSFAGLLLHSMLESFRRRRALRKLAKVRGMEKEAHRELSLCEQLVAKLKDGAEIVNEREIRAGGVSVVLTANSQFAHTIAGSMRYEDWIRCMAHVMAGPVDMLPMLDKEGRCAVLKAACEAYVKTFAAAGEEFVGESGEGEGVEPERVKLPVPPPGEKAETFIPDHSRIKELLEAMKSSSPGGWSVDVLEYQKQVNDLMERLTKLENAYQTDRACGNGWHHEMQNRLTGLEKALSTVERLIQEVSGLKGCVEEMRQMRQKMEPHIFGHGQAIMNLHQTISNLETWAEQCNQTFASLREADKVAATHLEVQQMMRHLRGAHAGGSYETAINGILTRLAEVEKGYTSSPLLHSLAVNVSDLEKKVENRIEEVLASAEKRCSARLNDFCTELKELREIIKPLRADAVSQGDHAGPLMDWKELEQGILSVRLLIQSLTMRHEHLQKDVAALGHEKRADVAELNTQQHNLLTDLQALSANVNTLRGMVGGAVADMQEARKELKDSIPSPNCHWCNYHGRKCSACRAVQKQKESKA